MSRYVQNILIVAGIILVVYLAGKYIVPDVFHVIMYILSLLVPFILAVLVSILMEPAVRFLEDRGNLPRGIAVGITMLIILSVLSFIIGVIVVRLVTELTELSIAMPRHISILQVYFQDWVEKGIIFYGTLPPAVSDQVQQNLIAFTETIQRMLRAVADELIYFISIIPSLIMFILISLIGTFFISRDRHEIARLWLRVMPDPWGGNILEISRKIAEAFMAYVRAMSVLVSITMVQSIIGLHLVGSNYALTLGIIIGILDMIPVLGPGTILLPWAIWSLLTGSAFFGVKLLVLYLFILVVRAILEPRIMGSRLGLHPLAVLVSMYVGLKTIGVLGLIVGPLFVIAVQAGIKSGVSLNR